MQFEIKEHINRTILIIVLLIATVLFGFLATVSAVLVLPVAIAFSAMFILTTNNNKIAIACFAGIAVALSVLFCCFGEINVIPLLISLSGILISVMFVKKVSKTELIVYLCALILTALTLTFGIELAGTIGSHNISDITEHLALSFDKAAEETLAMIHNSAFESETQLLMAEEIVIRSFDKLFNLLPAIIVITACLIVGIAVKIFTHLLYRICNDEKRVVFWRFAPSPIVA